MIKEKNQRLIFLGILIIVIGFVIGIIINLINNLLTAVIIVIGGYLVARGLIDFNKLKKKIK